MSNTVAGWRQFDNSQECIAKNASGVAMRMKIRQSKTPQFIMLIFGVVQPSLHWRRWQQPSKTRASCSSLLLESTKRARVVEQVGACVIHSLRTVHIHYLARGFSIANLAHMNIGTCVNYQRYVRGPCRLPSIL